MTANGKIGDPIPKGAIEDTEPSILAGPDRDGTEAEKDVSDRSTVDLAAIRDELVQLRESVAELTEATTRYAKRRFESVSMEAKVSPAVARVKAELLAGGPETPIDGQRPAADIRIRLRTPARRRSMCCGCGSHPTTARSRRHSPR